MRDSVRFAQIADMAWTWKHSSIVWLSVFVYITFDFFGYALCTLRQELAISIALFGIPFLQDRKVNQDNVPRVPLEQFPLENNRQRPDDHRALRQELAISIALFGIPFLQKRKIVPYMLICR